MRWDWSSPTPRKLAYSSFAGGYAEFEPKGDGSGQGLLDLTFKGIEEAELLEKSFLTRFATRNPVWWPVIVGVISGAMSLMVGEIIKHIIKG